MKRITPVHVLTIFWCAIVIGAWHPRAVAALTPPPLPAIAANENRVAAGTLSGTTLALDLDATAGRWYPDGPNKTGIPMQAFAERGHAPQAPGPLVRVRVGTDIRIRLRNAIAGTTLVVHNLVDLPSRHDRSLAVSSGAERIVRIHAYAPGTYYYWATTTGSTLENRFGPDSQLAGAIVVDPPDATRDDRIFVITNWDNVRTPNGGIALPYELLTINGRAWPATERLSYEQGANVRWRLINVSNGMHPMHLHGFPFAVSERGDGTNVRRIGGEREVTELVKRGETAAFAWTAARPGTWMFHCHVAYHILAHVPISMMLAGTSTLGFVETQTHMLTAPTNMEDAMGGLVLSVEIKRDSHVALAREIVPVRHLRLDVASQPGPTLAPDASIVPALRYTVSENGHELPANGEGAPAIVLARGIPVGIDVFNHLDEATTVHWHGIELQDPYYDGPVGFRNARNRSTPMIMPGATFQARFVPPRAGTFIYHAHMNDAWQVAGGLAGPLIVLEPGTAFDAASDHVVMLTTPNDSRYWGNAVNVNGSLVPQPIEIVPGTRQRLRLINLTTFDADVVVRLTSTDAPPMIWRLRARDGIDLAPSIVATGDVLVTIGSTRDLEFIAPARGHYALEIAPDRKSPAYVRVPFHLAERIGER